MKKILILSYHYPPYNTIASFRAKAYTSNFYETGIYPTIISHFWDGAIHTEVLLQNFSTYSEIRIPIRKTSKGNSIRFYEKNKWLNKISLLISWLKGHLDSTSMSMDSYISFRDYLFIHLESNKYDFIIGISSPNHHLKLCYEINVKYNIPYALDFRDLWSNRIIHTNYIPTITERLQDITSMYYWEKWLNKSKFYTITSIPWLNKIQSFSNTRGYVITNGFENMEYIKFKFKPNSNFKIIHTGSIYKNQNIHIFFQALKQLLSNKKCPKLEVIFYGAERNLLNEGKGINSIIKLNPFINKYGLNDVVKSTFRLKREDIIDHQLSADLLLFPSFPNSPGTYSGKIFEYLGARRPILSFPKDHSVVDDLIRQTNAGVICNTPNEIEAYLEKVYSDWLKTKELNYIGIEKEIQKHTRSSQVQKMANHILQVLNE